MPPLPQPDNCIFIPAPSPYFWTNTNIDLTCQDGTSGQVKEGKQHALKIHFKQRFTAGCPAPVPNLAVLTYVSNPALAMKPDSSHYIFLGASATISATPGTDGYSDGVYTYQSWVPDITAINNTGMQDRKHKCMMSLVYKVDPTKIEHVNFRPDDFYVNQDPHYAQRNIRVYQIGDPEYAVSGSGANIARAENIEIPVNLVGTGGGTSRVEVVVDNAPTPALIESLTPMLKNVLRYNKVVHTLPAGGFELRAGDVERLNVRDSSRPEVFQREQKHNLERVPSVLRDHGLLSASADAHPAQLADALHRIADIQHSTLPSAPANHDELAVHAGLTPREVAAVLPDVRRLPDLGSIALQTLSSRFPHYTADFRFRDKPLSNITLRTNLSELRAGEAQIFHVTQADASGRVKGGITIVVVR